MSEDRWKMVATEVMGDHGHLFVGVGATDAPAAVVRALKGRTAPVLGQELAYVRSIYRRQFHDPQRVARICEQYRAAATVDRMHDETDRDEQRRVQCPVLVLWSQYGAVNAWYDPIAVWRRWANDVTGRPVTCGHFLAEEEPVLTTQYLRDFLLDNRVGASRAARA